MSKQTRTILHFDGEQMGEISIPLCLLVPGNSLEVKRPRADLDFLWGRIDRVEVGIEWVDGEWQESGERHVYLKGAGDCDW